jgi:hypothetical protein
LGGLRVKKRSRASKLNDTSAEPTHSASCLRHTNSRDDIVVKHLSKLPVFN